MRILFLGNHTVGVAVLSVIARMDKVVGVVAHPHNPEDGVRYKSVFNLANAHGWPVIRGKGGDDAVATFVRQAKPDLIWVTDYRYLLPANVFNSSRLGAINLHPSLLPAYRGRAPVNWAILEGEKLLGLTAHFIDAGMDSGDIIAQVSYELARDEDVGDALKKLYPLYEQITENVLSAFRTGLVNRVSQDEGKAFSRPARGPSDGLIDWRQGGQQVCNLIRAVAAPYPGAYTYLDGSKIRVWRAELVGRECPDGSPGEVVGINGEDCPIVKCRDSAILLTKVESHRQIVIGDCMGGLDEF